MDPLGDPLQAGTTIDPHTLLTPITTDNVDQFPYVVHGTTHKFWPLIKQTGLNRMARTHIHMAVGLPGENQVISGMRSSSHIVIRVDVAAAMRAGIPFFVSANNVVLSPGVASTGAIAPRFFTRVDDVRKKTVLFLAGGDVPQPVQQVQLGGATTKAERLAEIMHTSPTHDDLTRQLTSTKDQLLALVGAEGKSVKNKRKRLKQKQAALANRIANCVATGRAGAKPQSEGKQESAEVADDLG